MSTAAPTDVTSVIDTNLDELDIQESLDYAADLNADYNDPSSQTTTQTKWIEVWAAVINIREYKEQMPTSESGGGFSASYEGNDLATARAELTKWLARAGGDPAMASSVIRDTDRHVTQTHED